MSNLHYFEKMKNFLSLAALICISLSLLITSSESAALNDYILDYQPLHFNPLHLHEKHNRMKRSLDPHLQWSFNAYNRAFNLHLQPATSVFADNHVLVFDDQPSKSLDTSFIYEGHLAGDYDSSAFISIINGSVTGHVIVPQDTTYHIEPAKNHFDNSEFHSIIYPESRMNLDPYRHRRLSSGSCGSRELYDKLSKKWRPLDNATKPQNHWERDFHNKYSAEANALPPKMRRKRDLVGNARTCIMSLQADNILYNYYLSKYGSEERTKEELIFLFASHISAINEIYKNTVFARSDNPSVAFRGVNFQLQVSKIMTSCANIDQGFCNDNLDVSNFLDLCAEDNFDEFCLVHTFTYRDFVGGTLGLAWVASTQSPTAGICGKHGNVRDSNNGIAQRSLNTGIVTLINFKNDVPARVSQLTFAHEVGHNFGAQHDATSECAPYGTNQPGASDGNYIMFPSATQGNLPNNKQFSVCSKDAIARVLETLKPKGIRDYCFQESGQPFCGNKIVEDGEECDCGPKEECTDKCCQGSEIGNKKSCTLVGNFKCSPSMGLCCNSNTCSFSDSNLQCQSATDCADSANCTNSSASCPAPNPKPDYKSFCSDSTKVCINRECIGSVCLNIGWKECFLTSAETTSVEQMCYVSCKENDTSECISSFDEAKVNANAKFKFLLQNIKNRRKNTDSTSGVKRPAGSPCNNFKGYCDVFSKCRNVDAEGPFKQLTDLIFNPVTLKNIRTWIEEHWWAVLLMCIGVVVFMGVFVKIFEYNTPSKNPKNISQQPPANRPQGGARPHQDKRSGAHSGELPLQDRGDYGGNRGFDNYGYQSSSSRPQQFDRVSRPHRY